jgi:hypothetical protein
MTTKKATFATFTELKRDPNELDEALLEMADALAVEALSKDELKNPDVCASFLKKTFEGYVTGCVVFLAHFERRACFMRPIHACTRCHPRV